MSRSTLPPASSRHADSDGERAELKLGSLVPDQKGLPCGERLREFLIKICFYRSSCILPADDETLTWDTIGLRFPDFVPAPACDSLCDFLQRNHYVLNLPESEFKKPGYFLVKPWCSLALPGGDSTRWPKRF